MPDKSPPRLKGLVHLSCEPLIPDTARTARDKDVFPCTFRNPNIRVPCTQEARVRPGERTMDGEEIASKTHLYGDKSPIDGKCDARIEVRNVSRIKVDGADLSYAGGGINVNLPMGLTDPHNTLNCSKTPLTMPRGSVEVHCEVKRRRSRKDA